MALPPESTPPLESTQPLESIPPLESLPLEPLSPYRVVLGDELDRLHPRLRAYFSAIPAGSEGRGSGTFDVAGTPRRWLWPVFWVLGAQGLLFAAWERDVPFVVVNRPVVDAAGRVAIRATREFDFARGLRTMVDAITATDGGLVDYLGRAGRYEASLAGTVVNGELHLRSTRMRLRIGGRWWALPAFFAPTVALTERFDDGTDRQRVSVILSAPVLGKLYEYSGSFSYEILAVANHEL